MNRRRSLKIVHLALLASMGSCAAGLLGFRVGPLPAAWVRVPVHAGDLVFHHPGGGAIAATSRCGPHIDKPQPLRRSAIEDVPLDVLTNHLLFGVQVQAESRRPLTLAGREAQSTEVRGTLDGVEVRMKLVVLKKDGCTYDLQLVAGPDVFAAREPDFSAFVRGFSPGAYADPPGGT